MSELRECPFCGCPDITIRHYNHSVASCNKCGADGPPAEGARGRDERVYMAARLWNTRTAPDKSAEEWAREVAEELGLPTTDFPADQKNIQTIAQALTAAENRVLKEAEKIIDELEQDLQRLRAKRHPQALSS